jgi:hypothetical protein
VLVAGTLAGAQTKDTRQDAGLTKAGQTKYGVTVLAVKPAPLAKAHTYVWMVGLPSYDKAVVRGLAKIASGAGAGDVTVTYSSLKRTDVKLEKGKESTEAAVGSLLLDIKDPKSKASLFRVRMDTPISSDPVKLHGEIVAAVAAMFAKYPASTKP